MRLTLRLFIFIAITFCFSCEEQGIFVNCDECVENEPFEAKIEARLEVTNYTGTVINLYEGNLEDSILIGTYYWYSTTFTHYVAINKKYTVTATYYVDGDYYVAVDSATPRVTYNKDQCRSPCYYIYDRSCDLRLKRH